jgi:hypothetical protein
MLGLVLCVSALVLPSGAAQRVPARSLHSLTATTCNGDTCQTISGSGTNVANWYTQTTAPGSVCTYAEFLEDGVLIAESSSTCIGAGQEAAANWSDPGYFPVGAQLCTTWTNIPGKPCDTIE